MSGCLLTARPLTAEGFAPFGTVIDTRTVAPRPMNAGKARRFHDLAEIRVSGEEARAVVGLVEAEPYPVPLVFSLVERHPFGSQAFIPLSAAPFLVVVCPDEDGRPGRPQPFLTAPWQGVCYAPHTWHGVLAPFGQPQNFVVVDRAGGGVNLEEFTYDEAWTVTLPE